MTVKNKFFHKHMIPLWIGVLSLILGFPTLGMAIGYGDGHHSSGHGMSPHGAGTYGHGGIHHGMSLHGGHGKTHGYDKSGSSHKFGHGPHQSASKFIEHILRFKEGMGITEEQATKLQKIKTDFKKTKIKMKADMQLANLDLHELLRKDQEDLSAVESKLKNLFEMRANLYLASVKAEREAKDVLTDEQRSRMKAVHDRINMYKEGGMMKDHPGGSSHPSKGKETKGKES